LREIYVEELPDRRRRRCRRPSDSPRTRESLDRWLDPGQRWCRRHRTPRRTHLFIFISC